jgi:hypothetical protein
LPKGEIEAMDVMEIIFDKTFIFGAKVVKLFVKMAQA